jgi:hypothetical protein
VATATATVTAADLRIVLTGAEFEPTGPAWDRATEAERRAYWRRLAEIAYFIKRQEIARGIGADGKKLTPVQPSSRPDGAKGQPLDPHYGESRTARLLAYSSTATGATLYWRAAGRKSWAVILGYHAHVGGEVRGAPLRDTIGISPRGRKQVATQARQWWATGRGAGARTAAEAVRQEAALRVAEAARQKAEARAQAEARRAAAAQVRRDEEERRKAEERRRRLEAAGLAREEGLSPEAVALRRRLTTLGAQAEVDDAIRSWVAGRASDPESVRMHGMSRAEPMRTLEWEGQTFRFADESAMIDRIRDHLLDPTWKPMPDVLKRATREIVLTTQEDRDSEYWGELYDRRGHNTTATGGDGSIVVYGGRPLNVATEAHEHGHNLALRLWGSTRPDASSDYARAMRDEDPVSDYARNSPDEDFAESWKYYYVAPDLLRARSPARYEVIRRMAGGPDDG